MKKRHAEQLVIAFVREADAALPIKELCSKHGFGEPSYYAWKAEFGGLKVSNVAAIERARGRERQAQATAGQLDAEVLRILAAQLALQLRAMSRPSIRGC